MFYIINSIQGGTNMKKNKAKTTKPKTKERTEQIVEQWGRAFLRVWKNCDEAIEEAKQIKKWDERCDIPSDVIISVSNKYRFKSDFERKDFCSITQALYAWRKNKIVYNYDSSFVKELLKVENVDFNMPIPSTIFQKLKHTTFACTYIDDRNRKITMFCTLADDEITSGKREIAMNLVYVTEQGKVNYVRVPMKENKTIAEVVADEHNRLLEEGYEFENTLASFNHNAALFSTIALYLCTENADIGNAIHIKESIKYNVGKSEEINFDCNEEYHKKSREFSCIVENGNTILTWNKIKSI